VDRAELDELREEMQSLIAALRQGEVVRANQLLARCRVPALAASGRIPAGAQGAAVRAAVEEALALAEALQSSRRAAVAVGGATRRALGAYGKRAAR
jgi:hypothetical protein